MAVRVAVLVTRSVLISKRAMLRAAAPQQERDGQHGHGGTARPRRGERRRSYTRRTCTGGLEAAPTPRPRVCRTISRISPRRSFPRGSVRGRQAAAETAATEALEARGVAAASLVTEALSVDTLHLLRGDRPGHSC